MKLLLCNNCQDIFNLSYLEKSCSCGKTKGRYIGQSDAEISGPCEPIGFDQQRFKDAITMQTIENKHWDGKSKIGCKGVDFTAYIVPVWSACVKRVTS